jgi:hypothetical protein
MFTLEINTRHNESADDRDLVTFSDFDNFHVKYKQQCNHLLLHLLLLSTTGVVMKGLLTNLFLRSAT